MLGLTSEELLCSVRHSHDCLSDFKHLCRELLAVAWGALAGFSGRPVDWLSSSTLSSHLSIDGAIIGPIRIKDWTPSTVDVLMEEFQV